MVIYLHCQLEVHINGITFPVLGPNSNRLYIYSVTVPPLVLLLRPSISTIFKARNLSVRLDAFTLESIARPTLHTKE